MPVPAMALGTSTSPVPTASVGRQGPMGPSGPTYLFEAARTPDVTDDDIMEAYLLFLASTGGTISLQTSKAITLYDRHRFTTTISLIGGGMTTSKILIGADGAGIDVAQASPATPENSSGQVGGMMGHFTIDGQGFTGCPLTIGKGNSRYAEQLEVTNAGDDGIRLYGTQNFTLVNCHLHDNGGYGVRIDYGAAGLVVLNGNLHGNGLGNVGVTSQGGYQHTPPVVPETTESGQIVFHEVILDPPAATAPANVVLEAGNRIQFVRCPMSFSNASSAASVIKCSTPNALLTLAHVELDNCSLQGKKYTGVAPNNVLVTGVDVSGSTDVIFVGETKVSSLGRLFSVADTARVYAQGDFISIESIGTNLEIATATTTPGDATHNEVQTLTISGSPSAGTFYLTWNKTGTTEKTGNLAYNASAATVQAALEALPSIGAGKIAVSGTIPGTQTMTFQSTLGLTDQPQIGAISNTIMNLFDNKGGTRTYERQVQGHRYFGNMIEVFGLSDRGLMVKYQGDVNPRWHIRPDMIQAGDGTTDPDTSFYRGPVAKSWRFDGYVKIGDLDNILTTAIGANLPALSHLPTPGATYRNYETWVRGDSSTTADEKYVCRYLEDGTPVWQKIRLKPSRVVIGGGAGNMIGSVAAASANSAGTLGVVKMADTGTEVWDALFFLEAWPRGYQVNLWYTSDTAGASSTYTLNTFLDLMVSGAAIGATRISANNQSIPETAVVTPTSVRIDNGAAYVPTSDGVYHLRLVRTIADPATTALDIVFVELIPL